MPVRRMTARDGTTRSAPVSPGPALPSPSGPVQIVVNPCSGAGRAVALARRLQGELRGRGYVVRTRVLGGPAETVRWARAVSGDFGCLLCVGGDATLDVIAPAAMRLAVPLVPVPAGFGNVFARFLGYGGRRVEYARLLEDGTVRWLDVGVTSDGVFLCSRGLGLLDRVERVVEEAGGGACSRAGRYAAYVRATWRILREEALPDIRVEVDGDRVAEGGTMVIVANVPAYHGFLNLMPGGSPDDGLLDVFVAPRTTKLRLLGLVMASALRIAGTAFHPVLRCRGKRVILSTGGAPPREFRALTRALPVLVPGSRRRRSGGFSS